MMPYGTVVFLDYPGFCFPGAKTTNSSYNQALLPRIDLSSDGSEEIINVYETGAGNLAGGRCAVPDDALDRRFTGRQGRGGGGGAESAGYFQRNLLATALHIR